MSKLNNTNTSNTASNNRHIAYISQSDLITDDIINQYYSADNMSTILDTTLAFIDIKVQSGITLPYFATLDAATWLAKSKELEVYITDLEHARGLNLEARGKDYATNILSYPSDLPPFILDEMPTLPLGELVICHEVVVKQATEQHKLAADHVSHLLVHGILHLLGFDHELGDEQADNMEGFEVAILETLGINNPYDK